MSQKEKERALGACFCSGRKDLYVEKKIILVPFFRYIKMMTNYEIFDLLYSEFHKKLEGDEIVFTQRYGVGN